MEFWPVWFKDMPMFQRNLVGRVNQKSSGLVIGQWIVWAGVAPTWEYVTFTETFLIFAICKIVRIWLQITIHSLCLPYRIVIKSDYKYSESDLNENKMFDIGKVSPYHCSFGHLKRRKANLTSEVLAVCLWGNYRTSLSLGFLVPMKDIQIFVSQGLCET